jgi:branched-chain amino acid transport system permease protein
MNYLLHVMILICIYSILAASLNLLVGYTGLLSLCHAAFYGIGAYVSTLLVMHLNLGFLPATTIAVAVTVLVSLTVSVPSVRLKGDYLVLASLGFQVIVFTILYNWTDLTGGPYGIVDIPYPKVFGVEIRGIDSYLVFSLIVGAICVALIYMMANSPFGRRLKTIRTDEMNVTNPDGRSVMSFKVRAFAISAGFAAIAGTLFAGYARYIDPTSFTLAESLFILSIIIIGGAGNMAGPLIGAVFMICLPEVLRLLAVPEHIAPQLRQIIYGLLIVLIMRFRPQGLAGEFRFE